MWGHDTSNAKCDDSKGHSLKIARCARRCGTTGRSSRAGDWHLCLPEAVPPQLYTCWALQDIQHQNVWTPELEADRERAAARRGVSLVGYSALMDYLHHMRRFNAPLIFTGQDWGLAGQDLPESTP